MTKKTLNQNTKLVEELINTIEPEFIFSSKPINRFKVILNNKDIIDDNKIEKLLQLRKQINSIENCNIQKNSKKLIMGDGNLNSPVMLIGETPGEIEENSGNPFQGDVGQLLDKMLSAINLGRKEIYLTYAINFRTPEDRKPTSLEINRYAIYLKEHITIIDPKIIILMGSTAMEAVTGLKSKISDERGNWKEIILKNKTFNVMTTFSPSYLIRFPDNKKHSWEDLKKIRQKLLDYKINIK